MNYVFNAIAGAATGILTGFGVGGGTLLILYMQTFTDIAQTAAQGINLAYFLPTAGASLAGHIRLGYVEKRVVFIAGGAGLAVTVLAAWIAGGIQQHTARKIFGVFLIIVGVYELLRGKKNAK